MTTFAERLNGLRWRLRATRRLWSGGADPTESFLPPVPQEPGPMGEIDVPGPGREILGPVLIVRGWAYFPDSPVARVEIYVNDRLIERARLAHLRPDVVEHHEAARAISSGFELAIEREVVELPEGPATVKAVATSVTGDRQVLGPVEVVLADPQGEDQAGKQGKRSLAPPPSPTPQPAGEGAPNVLVITHQLTLGGAQLYLLDLLAELVRTQAGHFTVITALDGPLRRDLEEMGIPVHVFGFPPADDPSSYLGRLEEMTSWGRDRAFDVALVNTATVFTLPAVEMARHFRIPYVWAIHESFHPSVLWSVLPPQLRERAEEAVAGAEALVFEADATRRLYEKDAGRARCLTLPYGLDFGPIDNWRASFDMREEREEAGIPLDAELVVCIGTIEPRKAQNTLAQAFDLIAAKHPRTHLAFVGGREDPDCEALEELIEASGEIGKRMHVIPITPDVHSWYGMADLLVCASDVESLPRTVLEAMAWETPVLATSVFGIPELIDDGQTGWLCDARDLEALAGGLDRALSSNADERAAIARAARALVEERHSPERYGRQIAELLGLEKGGDDVPA